MKDTLEHLLEVSRDTILAAQFCFLITLDEDGVPNARLMQPFEPDGNLVIHFGASADSRKVLEILSDPRAVLAYGLPDQGAYVTLKGTASIVNDPEVSARYWRESFAEYWPDGPGAAGYAVIRFVPERIEVMNFQRKVAPDPYGLKPASLIRTSMGWEVEYA